MRAENGKRVKVQFVGRLDDGTIFGETSAQKPLEFTLGQEQIIPGFEKAVDGMEPGQKKTVQLTPELAFGNYDRERVIRFKRSQFTQSEPISPGMKMKVEDTTGREFVGSVEALTDTSVTLDLNHPLAGKKLQFDIQVQEVA